MASEVHPYLNKVKQEARIRVIRAGPGSGKTSLFVDNLLEYADEWSSRWQGIAAMSFTNAARSEVTRRVAGTITYPHFLGTLDSFFLSYVLRPFVHLLGFCSKGVRLVPAPVAECLEFPNAMLLGPKKPPTSVFAIHLNREDDGNTTAWIPSSYGNQRVDLKDDALREALRLKHHEWRARGRVTHSDCQYLSASLLADETIGEAVSKIVTGRFPVILVDELQDTNRHLGASLLRLLAMPNVQGLVVGDPDQAIYDFGGAYQHIFEAVEGLEGSKGESIEKTHRCPVSVCQLASELAGEGRSVVPAEAAEHGSTILLWHELRAEEVGPNSIAAIVDRVSAKSRWHILSRKNLTVRRLRGVPPPIRFSGRSQAARKIAQAVEYYYRGEPRIAAQIVERELSFAVFKDETPSRDEMRTAGVQGRQWRHSIGNILQTACLLEPLETWNDWVVRVKEAIEREAASHLEDGSSSRLGRRFMRDSASGNTTRETLGIGVNPQPSEVTVSTVHQVKGMQFPCVAYFFPKPHAGHSPCPSEEWWTVGREEERRIAYVAVTRTQSMFALVVHRSTLDDLLVQQPDFVSKFETVEALFGDSTSGGDSLNEGR